MSPCRRPRSRGPLKASRYLPAIGRFLIVVTFLEDALRIVTQWNDQLVYLHDWRHCKRTNVGQSASAHVADS